MTRLVAGDPGAENFQAYLNGELLEWCIEADDVEGYAIVFDIPGSPFDFHFEEIPTKRMTGNVEFRPGSFDK
jgi:hypothetical protein